MRASSAGMSAAASALRRDAAVGMAAAVARGALCAE